MIMELYDLIFNIFAIFLLFIYTINNKYISNFSKKNGFLLKNQKLICNCEYHINSVHVNFYAKSVISSVGNNIIIYLLT